MIDHSGGKENQNVEWKQSWRDAYLKWVCGFANADGGLLVVGRDDDGVAVGIPNARRLLEEIPNKVRNLFFSRRVDRGLGAWYRAHHRGLPGCRNTRAGGESRVQRCVGGVSVFA